MGQPKKLPLVVEWLKSIQCNKEIQTRKFLSNVELFNLYNCQEHNIEINLKGITTLLNRIVENNNYANFRQKYCSCKPTDKRVYEYILLANNETHLHIDDIRVSNRRTLVVITEFIPKAKYQKMNDGLYNT